MSVPDGASFDRPGHDLNRFVAERVMGWTSQDAYRVRWSGHWYYGDQYDAYGCRQPFDPSGSLVDAWSVVERMQSLGYGFGVIGYPTCDGSEPGPPFRVRFFSEESEFDGAGTIEMAICLAALKAVS